MASCRGTISSALDFAVAPSSLPRFAPASIHGPPSKSMIATAIPPAPLCKKMAPHEHPQLLQSIAKCHSDHHLQPCFRRTALFFISSFVLGIPLSHSAAAASLPAVKSADSLLTRIEQLLQQASEAWGDGLDPSNTQREASLNRACGIFDTIVALDPDHTEWLEARGQVRIDAKRFKDAVADFDEVVRRNPNNFRAFSGRALAHEGLAEWEHAVDDYTQALEKGQVSTGYVEPYVINSRGNAFASLGRYSDALQDYLLSVEGFQKAKELDGAIYAAGNAALMRVQLGDEVKGMKELLAVARRAPASIDMRAALAALYWSQGEEQAAEDEWRFACENINAGQLFDSCALYKDQDWLRQIRRWPPVMVERMENFLRLKSFQN